MSNILGKSAKTLQSNWNLVSNSVKKLTASQLKNCSAYVFPSKYNEGRLVMRVVLGKSYADFQVDITSKLQDGDKVDPASIRVYQLTNGEKPITRINGKAL